MANYNAALQKWKTRLSDARSKYSDELAKMDERDLLYAGERKAIDPVVASDTTRRLTATHIHNIVAENIESLVDNVIPPPKVTARREEDQPLAKMIEDMLRIEMDRLPMEMLVGMMDRTVPIQGGGFWFAEWDNSIRTHDTVGDVVLSALHPKQFIPQDGVYTGLQDMDYFFLGIPQTKAHIRAVYGIDVDNAAEEDAELKSTQAENQDSADEMITQWIAYYKGKNGAIGKYSWAGEAELENLPNCQARRAKMCSRCGAPMPLRRTEPIAPTMDGSKPNAADFMLAEQLAAGGDRALFFDKAAAEYEAPKQRGTFCPYCGGTEFREDELTYEELYFPVQLPDGSTIGGYENKVDADGEIYMDPVRVPHYNPGIYPVIMQRNVPRYGKVLGDSDVDRIAAQQNTLNRLDMKINERILKAGTRITLPPRTDISIDSQDSEFIYLDKASDKAMIGAYDFTGNLEYELYWRGQVYEQARQVLGITNSYQGRVDATATSGKAKEFAAQQSAGRLESKKVEKAAAFAQIYELIFKLRLAYQDEPRPIFSRNERGETIFDHFDRYAFLRQDPATGEYFWNDDFLFSTDNSSSLAQNREAMWQEATSQLQSGAFGNPQEIDTLILYWTKLESQHYPTASETKQYLIERKQELQAAQQMQQQLPPMQPDTAVLP